MKTRITELFGIEHPIIQGEGAGLICWIRWSSGGAESAAYRDHGRGCTMFPEITVTELAAKLKSDEQFILLDVRELFELSRAKMEDARLEVAPISRLSQSGTDALSEAARWQTAVMYVMCHHGNRSRQVTAWLAGQGWKNVFNVRGGIEEYARKVDSSVGFY